VTKLYDEPFHVIARREIAEFADLAGKPVAVGPKASGADSSGRTLLRLLNMDVEIVNLPWPEAIEQLMNGSVSALIYPTRKPSKRIRRMSESPLLHMLSMPPADAEVLETYSPITLTSADYPGFIGEGETRNTLQFAAILTVFNWQPDAGIRYTHVSRSLRRLVANMNKLRSPSRHPAWRTVNLADDVKGWERYAPMQKLLDAAPKAVKAPVAVGGVLGDGPPSIDEFKRFMEYMRQTGGKPDASEQELFDAYINYQVWRRNLEKEKAASGN